eukprot:Nitzschia sp. Nitz4//scaffold154_size52827//19130//21215//NITZ4_006775-RA/size52827-snap-gene-0.2-mRNA-1//1//CDS//3329537305//8476//frame0
MCIAESVEVVRIQACSTTMKAEPETEETAETTPETPATPGQKATTEEETEENPSTPGAPVTNVVSAEGFVYDTEADTDEFKRSFALNFSVKKKPKSIFVMTLGLPEYQGILDRPPLSVVKRKEVNEAYVPKADDFKNEVKRRAHFFMNMAEEASYITDDLQRNHPLKTRRNKIVLPQPNQWLNTRLKKWLQERPMKPNDTDLKFLRSEVNKALAFLANESLAETGTATPASTYISDANKTAATPGSVLGDVGTPVATPLIAAPSTPFVLSEFLTNEYTYTTPNDSNDYKRSAALTYTKMDNKPRVIIAMALGMGEFEGLLDRPPFSVAKRRELTDDFMPRAEDYRYEIKRRAHFFMHNEEETNYFVRELHKKNPLENMRGVVSIPQPNQWKIQALRGWLAERPLKPNEQDMAFIREGIAKIVSSLMAVIDREKDKVEDLAKEKTRKMPWGTASATGPGAALGTDDKEGMLVASISKQESLLQAVSKQTSQQSLLNKITILNQGISSYQQEISSLRSTLNDLENRMLTIEMKIAETPSAEERLKVILAKQQETKDSTEAKIAEWQAKIDDNRSKIETMTAEMDSAAAQDAAIAEPPTKKTKIEEIETADV